MMGRHLITLNISRHPGSMIARVQPHQDDPKLPILNTGWAYAD
jgi:hypothetical protein